MARYKPDSKVSYRLEEEINIGPWYIVGTPEWFDESFSPEYVQAHLKDRCIVVLDKSDINRVIRAIEPARSYTIDTESSGERKLDGLDALSPTSKIVLFQIGVRDQKQARDGTYVVEPQLVEEFRPILENDKPKILQNAVHDYRFVYAKCGIAMQNIFCTMLAEQLLTAGKEGVGVGLADLVRKYPPHHLISKNVREEFIQHTGRFTPQQLFYAARDVYVLPPVARAQHGLLDKKHMLDVAQLEFENIPATAEMGLTGVLLYVKYLRESLAYHTMKRDGEERKIFAIFNAELQRLGVQEFDLLGPVEEKFKLASNPEKRAAFRRLGVEIEKTDTEVLAELEHPMAEPMIKWSGHNKIISNYGETLIDKVHFHTGRFHPDFDQLGAGEGSRDGRDKKETIATGRYSSNFQQLPRPEKVFEPIPDAEEAQVRHYFRGLLAELGVTLPTAA
jgi:DNA polymerase I-like protein with 3'-5' exonuclease and polymerase domains